ncbi:hypothetical protein OQA88_12983 [Cercophora sp. LCS_1]
MKSITTTIWALSLSNPALAAGPAFLTGYGFTPYDPLCAESCLRSLSSYMLACSPASDDHSHSHMSSTPPECYADDTPFLTSVAWCFHSRCASFNIPVSKLQRFWEQSVTGTPKVAPKWPYSVALANITSPPTYQLGSDDTHLNQTSLVVETTYLAQWNVLGGVAREGLVESNYSFAIIFTSLGLPILLTLLWHLPVTVRIIRSLNPYITYPALIGTYQVRPLPYLLGNGPTVAQTLYIALFFALNVVLTAVSYTSAQPNAWFADTYHEIGAYVLYRTGTLGFTLLPILILFAGRNNILLWVTNWSHSTFLLLHRWVARVFTLYVVVHSIIGLRVYAANANTTWWIWGAVATIATVASTLGSGLYVRKGRYELFLVSHILLAVFVVVGCWYHVTIWYGAMGIPWPEVSWGYEVWVYFAVAVWFFDRAVRVGRVVKGGALRSRVTELGDGYARVDVPSVRWGTEPGKHVYAYFPTLDWRRPWENHPFSVIPTCLLRGERGGEVEERDEEKQNGIVRTRVVSDGGAGITLFIKKEGGMTRLLKSQKELLTLLDGPYTNNNTREVLRCDRVLLIAGGIGVTGVLPWAHNHRNVKFVWGVSESAHALVDAVELGGIAEKEVRIGRRFDVAELIEEEASAGWDRVGVVVSGPGGLCDDVRAAVAKAGRNGKTAFELEVDAYSW